ncbi:putative ras gtpase activating protein [Erysiphe necator]|uniref:Putative ras gtpase activating protein n=1 Tax=Uncinula necator TaxID=52586 RepID=A0A0B1PAX8_UNCNE|nr:putative ras gtpase activating protein [Erysiphe necator]
MPSFENMGADFGLNSVPKSKLEKIKSEEDLIRSKLEKKLPIIYLQAQAEGAMNRLQLGKMMHQLWESEETLIYLQSIIRGDFARQVINYRISMQRFLTSLQSIARGFLTCQRQAGQTFFWIEDEEKLIILQNLIRAKSLTLDNLKNHAIEIKKLQAVSRAIIFRRELSIFLAQLEEEEDSIIVFQAATQASLFQKVVKIQSFVRSCLQGEAYKILTTGKNPPVNTGKNLVHLLSDSDFDFNEEIEFERLRKTVVQQVRRNEMAEQYIDQLDIKIALLFNNKITLDEVVRHQKNFGGQPSNLLVNITMASGNKFDLKAINKSSRKKFESYQQLFFILQTQPHYLAMLFKLIRQQGTSEIDCKRIETLMMVLFGYV